MEYYEIILCLRGPVHIETLLNVISGQFVPWYSVPRLVSQIWFDTIYLALMMPGTYLLLTLTHVCIESETNIATIIWTCALT